MALIAMATYCTEENCSGTYPRNEILAEVLNHLQLELLLHPQHRLIIIDNSPGDLAKDVLRKYDGTRNKKFFDIIDNKGVNLGTADAINKAWRLRREGEHCVKMDDDCQINDVDGVFSLMEEAIKRDPKIGIVGLKRKDCIENPNHSDPFYRSELEMLPHNPGEKWMIIEKVSHVMGTCQMYSDALLKKMGYLMQPEIYGFDDVWASFRSDKLGFINCFLPYVDIDHIDPGDTDYQKKKEAHATKFFRFNDEMKFKWERGELDLYHEPDWDKLENQKSQSL